MGPDLKIGQRLQVRLAYTDDQWYSSRVEDLGDEVIVIGAPLKGGAVIPIHPGELVEGFYSQPDGFFVFQAEVLERRLEPVPVLLLRCPDGIRKVQRRRHFRLPVVLPVYYEVKGAETTLKGSTLDLSGGGLCIATGQPLKPGQELQVKLELSDGTTITAAGRVISCAEVENAPKQRRYSSGIQFVDLPAPVEERIVSFVFREQRERRWREAGRW
ncbi:MAG: flagellar brake protein [Chitinophagales bacterium]